MINCSKELGSATPKPLVDVFADEAALKRGVSFAVNRFKDELKNRGYNDALRCLDLLLFSKGFFGKEKRKEVSSQMRDMGSIGIADYLDSLQKNDKIMLRRDNTHSLSHEIRQGYTGISLVDSGLINDDVVKLYGPEEILIATSIIHDLKEDFGLTSEQLAEYMMSFRDYKKQVVDRVCRNLDLITYKCDGEYVYPNNDQNLYMNALLGGPYVLLAKYIDRNDNLATMINAFSLGKMQDYLSKTYSLFSNRDTLGIACAHYAELSDAYTSVDNMMHTLYRMGHFYVEYHPERNNIEDEHKNLFTDTAFPIAFNGTVRKSFKGHQFVPKAMHHLLISLDRTKKSLNIPDSSPIFIALEREMQESDYGLFDTNRMNKPDSGKRFCLI